MALTDSDRLHAATIAIMRHNVISHAFILAEPRCTESYSPEVYLGVNDKLTANDYLSMTSSYTIT
jgi:hypothetical protein